MVRGYSPGQPLGLYVEKLWDCRGYRTGHRRERVLPNGRFQWVIDLSEAGAYCDQAHMAHEFREFAGISPGAWLSGDRPFLNHAAID